MAENKKSFLLYADLLHTVRKMPIEKAGELFTTILEYVNDQNPVVEDLMVELVFEPIKQQLKRDLNRWEQIKDTKSQGGIIGNLKRWRPDLYSQYASKKITLEQAIEQANNRIPSDTDKDQSHTVANVAVNDTVTVNVNDTVNVTDNVNTDRGVNEKSASKKPTPLNRKVVAAKSFENTSCVFSNAFKKNWLALLESKKWVKKEQNAIDMSLKQLMKFDEEFANALVEKAIAGAYQGVVFGDTEAQYDKYIKSKNGHANSRETAIESRTRMYNLARNILTGNQA